MQNRLRHGYYAILNPPVANTSLVGYQEHQGGAVHVAHCFDYLRQSVQCAADTNIEPVDFALGGVTGWGVKRVCRDFEEVKRLAEEWRPGNH